MESELLYVIAKLGSTIAAMERENEALRAENAELREGA